LEASRRMAASPVAQGEPVASGGKAADAGGADAETNDAAEEMMRKALEAREKKRRETEEARRTSDLASSGGMKKGFLSSAKAPKAKRQPKPQEDVEEVPFIGGLDPESARRESLKLPEVQQALQQNMSKLQEDKSWVTPTLLNALQSRPDLLQGLSNPRVQEAMALMQRDPEEAKRKFAGDADVAKFLQEFSGLMATHFDVLSKEAPKPVPGAGAPAPVPMGSPASIANPLLELEGAQVARPASRAVSTQHIPPDDPAAKAMADPKVSEAFQDPEVQALLSRLYAGQNLEMHELARENPRLFMKVQILLDAGLLGTAR